MTTIGSLLPKPKNSQISDKNDPEGDQDTNQILSSSPASNIPPYGKRSNWRPKSQQDFGDGGAYPEVHVAQYPLGMGKKNSAAKGKKKSNKLAASYDREGNVKYDVVAKRGHDKATTNIQTSYNDLIPLRQKADMGQVSLEKPTDEQVEETTENTRQALDKLLNKKIEKSRPQAIAKRPDEPTYVRYTPASQVGSSEANDQQRIIRVQDYEQDPLAPSKFKQALAPGRPPSPPAPVLHSPPRKVTKEEREQWYIPPAVSNWKNPKGFVVALDKRVAADGRALHENAINPNKAKLQEALDAAEETARKNIRERQAMQQRLAEKENAAKEEQLRELARQARMERHRGRDLDGDEDDDESKRKEDRRRSSDGRGSEEVEEKPHRSESENSDDDETEESRKRAEMRRERQKEREKEMRMSRMGSERRFKAMAKEQDRDISERVALGLAKPTELKGDSQFDSRLFNHGSATSRYNEDQIYDKSLFASREAINSIYKNRGKGVGAEQDEAERIAGEQRFESLGQVKRGFQGADKVEARDGPVEFEKADESDPYGIDAKIKEYGLDRDSKRQRRDS